MKRAVFLCAVACAAEPRLWYSKSFPGSQPAYVEIALERNGACEYKEAPNDDYPIKLELSRADTDEMFGLADKLGRFTRPLESPLKVARMGIKTFRYLDGAKQIEVQFNFTEDLDGRALHDWFEKISETGQYYIALERSVKYEKLGVNKAILLFETALERKRIVSPALFLPLLDRVAKNEAYINMARNRAAALAEAIRAAK